MFFIIFYLVKLFIAPHIWVTALIGLRVDYFFYPIWALAGMMSEGRKYLFKLSALDKVVLCILAWYLFASYFNSHNDKTFSRMVEFVVWFGMYKLVGSSLLSLDKIKRAVFWMVAICFVLVIEGIQHKLSPDGIGWAGQELGWVVKEVLEAGGTGRTQWIAIFDGPGVFAVIYTTPLPFLLPLTSSRHGIFLRIIALTLIVLFCIALYFTGSRGGILAGLGIFGLYLTYVLNISIGRIVLVCTVALVAFMLAPAHLTSTSDSSRSAQYRVETWADTVDLAEKYPINGVGIGNLSRHTTQQLIAHNSALEVLGSTGFPGFFMWSLMLVLAYRILYLRALAADNKNDEAFVVSLGISLTGYLISAMFVSLEQETFYFLIALCAAAGNQLETPVTIRMKDLKYTGIGVIAFVYSVKIFSDIYFNFLV